MSEGTAQFDEPAETVEIAFDGRVFVWHSFPEGEEHEVWGSVPLGPSVTSTVDGEPFDVVATELERLLSALTFSLRGPR
jgi:hypothetical protein